MLSQRANAWMSLKIDVEGAELAVLQGMTRIITENRDVVIIAEFGSSHLKAAGITPDAVVRRITTNMAL